MRRIWRILRIVSGALSPPPQPQSNLLFSVPRGEFSIHGAMGSIRSIRLIRRAPLFLMPGSRAPASIKNRGAIRMRRIGRMLRIAPGASHSPCAGPKQLLLSRGPGSMNEEPIRPLPSNPHHRDEPLVLDASPAPEHLKAQTTRVFHRPFLNSHALNTASVE